MKNKKIQYMYVILNIKNKNIILFQVFTDNATIRTFLKISSEENEHIEPKAFMVVMPYTAFKSEAYLT